MSKKSNIQSDYPSFLNSYDHVNFASPPSPKEDSKISMINEAFPNSCYFEKKQTFAQGSMVSPSNSGLFVAPQFLQTLPIGRSNNSIQGVNSFDLNSIGLKSPLEIESNRDCFYYYDMLQLNSEEMFALQNINTMTFGETDWVIDEETKEVMAASFEQLVIYLTSPDANNLSFQTKFLTTFVSFATPNYLLGALFTRYFPNFDMPNCNIQPNNIKPIYYRIIQIITKWFKTAPYMFQTSNNLLVPALEDFCNYLKTKPETALLQKVLKGQLDACTGLNVVNVKYTSKQKIPDMLPLPQIPPDQWHLDDIDPIELARQVTQYHCSIFMNIGPLELLTAIWGPKKGGGAPNLDKLAFI